jgi:hypothetical protein
MLLPPRRLSRVSWKLSWRVPHTWHDADRSAVRHGYGEGSVTLGGRRVPVRRPRVRAVDGSGELPVAAYEVFAGTDVLGAMAMQRMLGGGRIRWGTCCRSGR